MKAQPLKFDGEKYIPCNPEEATHIRIKIQDRKDFFGENIIPVQVKGSRAGTGNWTWNGSTDKPTIKPSLLQWFDSPHCKKRCHTWITDGQVIFLSDCTHELAGQTVDLLEVEE